MVLFFFLQSKFLTNVVKQGGCLAVIGRIEAFGDAMEYRFEHGTDFLGLALALLQPAPTEDGPKFERERILAGMARACEKLNVLTEDLEAATTRIEIRCHEEYDREVPSAVIGNLVMEELKNLNQVAYVRFASVYREFKDVSQFLDELKPILEGRNSGG